MCSLINCLKIGMSVVMNTFAECIKSFSNNITVNIKMHFSKPCSIVFSWSIL